MTVMICASIAYDTVMVFDGRFKEHILPDRIHMLSVSFLVPQMRRNFGGVGGNIAYNLALLGMSPRLLGTVGDDFDPYGAWMQRNGIALDDIHRVAGTYTAQAFITTDLDDNQITAFHPGALQHAGEYPVPRDAGITIGLVGPDSRDAMVAHARQFSEAGIPFIFDVGQGLPMFSGEDLLEFIGQATWVIVNDYEGQLIQERTGLSAEQIAARCSAYIVTRGAEGSRIYAGGQAGDIPAVAPTRVVDPTGCGDAYRAGLIYGIVHGLDWATTGRLASLIGSIKIAHHGTQTHHFDLEEIQERFHQAFGYRF
jgi:adenosine kinase